MSSHSRVHRTPFKGGCRRSYSPMTTDSLRRQVLFTRFDSERRNQDGRARALRVHRHTHHQATGRPSWSRLPSRASSKRRRREPSSWPTSSLQAQPRPEAKGGPAAGTAVSSRLSPKHLRVATDVVHLVRWRPTVDAVGTLDRLAGPSGFDSRRDRSDSRETLAARPPAWRPLWGDLTERRGASPAGGGPLENGVRLPARHGAEGRSVQAVWRHTNSRNRAGDSMILPRRYSDSDCAPHLWELPGRPKTPEEPASTRSRSSVRPEPPITGPRVVGVGGVLRTPRQLEIPGPKTRHTPYGRDGAGTRRRRGSNPRGINSDRLLNSHRPRERPPGRVALARVTGLRHAPLWICQRPPGIMTPGDKTVSTTTAA